MEKLVKGIVEFRKNVLPTYRERFAKLALGQSPDTLFIACSDSRVAVNVFASTEPGDLFVVRNVGNLIPPCGTDGHSLADESEAAAIEFAVNNLKISHVVVCGHSECAAMHALVNGREKVSLPNLHAWLRHGEPGLKALPAQTGTLSPANRLSQLNVLAQLEHLRTYPAVRERIASGKLQLHAWWFELQTADVWAYDEETKQYGILDEAAAQKILGKI